MKFGILILLFILAVIINILSGSTWISFSEVTEILFKSNNHSPNYFIVWQLRLPKTITAILVGIGLPVSGLLLQSIFRNPLAGPFVLGISSGASLGVASFVMFGGAGIFASSWLLAGGLSLFSILGSLLVLLAVISVSIKVNDTLSLLIVGMMFGSVTGAVVSIMQYFSSAELLQKFIIWTFGSLGGLHWNELVILSSFVILSLIVCLRLIKPLNAMLINEEYAINLGVNIKNIRIAVILISGILAGSITAFAGPIAFVGVAVPHLARNIFKSSDHRLLLPAVILIGAILMLICDTISQFPGSSVILPINSVTAIFGAPVIIWIIIQNKKYNAKY